MSSPRGVAFVVASVITCQIALFLALYKPWRRRETSTLTAVSPQLFIKWRQSSTILLYNDASIYYYVTSSNVVPPAG